MDSYSLDVENSFLYFLITLQKLHLSEKVKYTGDTVLVGFVPRNKRYLRKPESVLVL